MSQTNPTSNPKTPDEWSLEDARKYAAEARERGHNPEDQCNSGWLVRLDAEIERLTRGMNGQADVMVAREREFAAALLRLDELERANVGLATESDRLRAALDELMRLAGVQIRHSTHYEGCADDHPWCKAFCIAQGALSSNALSERSQSPSETTASPQAPIALLTVSQAGEIAGVTMYAPGLPPGDHDLYCEPEAVAPMMRAEKASGDPT